MIEFLRWNPSALHGAGMKSFRFRILEQSSPESVVSLPAIGSFFWWLLKSNGNQSNIVIT
jgi:hypothetical protein